MSNEITEKMPEFVTAGMNLFDTELTLALPGVAKSGAKREFPGSFIHQNKSNFKKKLSEQVVGWPPVRAHRKSIMTAKTGGGKYVKVAVDGVPYLRKVDIEMYNSYEELLRALKELFNCYELINGIMEDYLPTYEDKDGDWMLVGDVPWEMFTQSCKRLRLMTRSEAIGLGPRTPPKCSSSSR